MLSVCLLTKRTTAGVGELQVIFIIVVVLLGIWILQILLLSIHPCKFWRWRIWVGMHNLALKANLALVVHTIGPLSHDLFVSELDNKVLDPWVALPPDLYCV